MREMETKDKELKDTEEEGGHADKPGKGGIPNPETRSSKPETRDSKPETFAGKGDIARVKKSRKGGERKGAGAAKTDVGFEVRAAAEPQEREPKKHGPLRPGTRTGKGGASRTSVFVANPQGGGQSSKSSKAKGGVRGGKTVVARGKVKGTGS